VISKVVIFHGDGLQSEAGRFERLGKESMTRSKCPYCADPDFFDKILTASGGDRQEIATMPRRGSHWPKGKKPKRNVPHVQYARWGVIDPRAVVTLKSPEIVRGKFRIRTITDVDMIKRYAGFKVQIIGIEARDKPPVPWGRSSTSAPTHAAARRFTSAMTPRESHTKTAPSRLTSTGILPTGGS